MIPQILKSVKDGAFEKESVHACESRYFTSLLVQLLSGCNKYFSVKFEDLVFSLHWKRKWEHLRFRTDELEW